MSHQYRGAEVRDSRLLRTGILDTMLRQNTMTPVADTADGLNATSPKGSWWIWRLHTVIFGKLEALAEAYAHLVPRLPMRMAYALSVKLDKFGQSTRPTGNRFIGSYLDVVRKG